MLAAEMAVREVPPPAVLPLRVQVLWPDAPHKAHVYGDEKGVHIAAMVDGQVVGCVSVFVDLKAKEAQVRKFAVAPEFRKQGVGTVLLHHAVSRAARAARATFHHSWYTEKATPFRIFLNARYASLAWYEERGFRLAAAPPPGEAMKTAPPPAFPDADPRLVFYRGADIPYATMELEFDASAPPFVVGAGFGRTGTMSLKFALDRLGYKCYHMIECVKGGLEHNEMFLQLARDRPKDRVARLREFFTKHGFTAAVDWPACTWWRSLCFAFPGAVVILTERDFEPWHASCYRTINMPQHDPLLRLRRHLAKRIGLARNAIAHASMVDAVIWSGTFGGARFRLQGHEADKAEIRAVFEQNTASVVAEVPAASLVRHRATEGWGPLVSALGKPAPDAPYPRVNDTRAFQSYFARSRMEVRLGFAAVFLSALTLGARTRRRRRPPPPPPPAASSLRRRRSLT